MKDRHKFTWNLVDIRTFIESVLGEQIEGADITASGAYGSKLQPLEFFVNGAKVAGEAEFKDYMLAQAKEKIDDWYPDEVYQITGIEYAEVVQKYTEFAGWKTKKELMIAVETTQDFEATTA